MYSILYKVYTVGGELPAPQLAAGEADQQASHQWADPGGQAGQAGSYIRWID